NPRPQPSTNGARTGREIAGRRPAVPWRPTENSEPIAPPARWRKHRSRLSLGFRRGDDERGGHRWLSVAAVPSMHQQHRQPADRDDLLRRAAEQKLVPRAVAVGAHDQEVAAGLARLGKELVTDGNAADGRDAAIGRGDAVAGEMRLQRLAGALGL